jgi:hypothetical protein
MFDIICKKCCQKELGTLKLIISHLFIDNTCFFSYVLKKRYENPRKLSFSLIDSSINNPLTVACACPKHLHAGQQHQRSFQN